MENKEIRNIKLILSYDGGSYLGWQKSAIGVTIESELQKVLEQIFQSPLELNAASRTDAGVHAEYQVVNFLVKKKLFDLKRLHMSLNQMLPSDIRIWEVEEVPLSFHATLEAKSKEYHYQLTTASVQSPFERNFSWHLYTPLPIDLMKQTSKIFLGTHDFSSFCNVSELPSLDPICTLHRIDLIEESSDKIRIEIEGNRFLYKMVRNLVGTLVDIGRKKIALDKIPSLLSSKDRKKIGITAPAYGLCLKRVNYEE